ncbi:pentapeptide repeat-containing protein [Nonomuraea sp. NPDC051941]|uniref:pentapeptide repeat-containing protein n=1 Tax=Nonomuraea sp. NPDC051941 TaxID=3364373 RepID=UPI0037C947E3
MLGTLTLLPHLLYPPLTDTQLNGVKGADTRIQLQQAQSQLQNNARSTLLQAVAGLLVVAGAVATWRQVQVNREGQITERFTRAVDQLGSDNTDVRVGGIYALRRIADNSPSDRNTVQFILGAFIRTHAAWPVGMPDGPEHPTTTVDQHLPWLHVRAPDIQTAMDVLGNRPTSPEARRLYLSRVDLRSVQLDGARLIGTQLRHANLARAWLRGVRLDHSDLKSTDLRQTNLENASFVESNLRGAHLEGANLRGADFSRADLRGADLRGADLTDATLVGALVDATTAWPLNFDTNHLPHAGIHLINDESEPSNTAIE